MKNKKFFLIILLAINFVIIIFFISNCVMANNKNVYNILVDVEESRLYLFKKGNLEKEYKCAGGKASTPSPIGTWTIISKGKWGEGFGGSWMRV